VATMLNTLALSAFFTSGIVFFCPSMDDTILLAQLPQRSKLSHHFCSMVANFSNSDLIIP
jgi:hypothetical protein